MRVKKKTIGERNQTVPFLYKYDFTYFYLLLIFLSLTDSKIIGLYGKIFDTVIGKPLDRAVQAHI